MLLVLLSLGEKLLVKLPSKDYTAISFDSNAQGKRFRAEVRIKKKKQKTNRANVTSFSGWIIRFESLRSDFKG